MEEFNQSNEFKKSILEQLEKKACMGCPNDTTQDRVGMVDQVVSKISNVLFNRLLREWALTLDDAELQRLVELSDKLSGISVVEFCADMQKHGHSNPFQVFGELLANDFVDVEELSDDSVEEVSRDSSEISRGPITEQELRDAAARLAKDEQAPAP